MNIRTSTLLVGVRGTSGWVDANDGLSRAYILKGKVECSSEGQTVQVSAGEMAELRSDGELTVKEFADEDLPAFVQEELDDDPISNPDNSEVPETTFIPEGDVIASGETGNLTWILYSDGTLTISGTGPLDSVLWPDSRDQVYTVIIGDGVTGIGRELFKNHNNLERITISGSVTSIGFEAFYGCRSLTEVIMLEGVTSIGDSAFCNCSNLTAAPDGESFLSNKLPINQSWRYEVFDVIVDFLISQGGRAKKGNGRFHRLGEPEFGAIGYRYFHAGRGASVLDPVFVLAAVLEWAGIAGNERGELVLTAGYREV